MIACAGAHSCGGVFEQASCHWSVSALTNMVLLLWLAAVCTCAVCVFLQAVTFAQQQVFRVTATAKYKVFQVRASLVWGCPCLDPFTWVL